MAMFKPEFKEGALYLIPAQADDHSQSLPVPMHEGGWISLKVGINDLTSTHYFSRVPARDEASVEPEQPGAIAKPSGTASKNSDAKSETYDATAERAELRYDGSYCWFWTNSEGVEMHSILHFAPDGRMVSVNVGGSSYDLDDLLKRYSFENPELNTKDCYSYTFDKGTIRYFNKNYGYDVELKLENGVIRSEWQSEVYGGRMVTEEYLFYPFK